MPALRHLQLHRPDSFLPVYSLIVAGIQLWLAFTLIGADRTWLVYDPAHPLRLLPLILAVLLGLGAIALWIAAWVVRSRGRQPMNRVLFHLSTVGTVIVTYALLLLAGHGLGFL